MGKRTRKSTKKAWRKADITDVEEHLDEIREQNRISGPLSRKQDSDLFVFDAKPSDLFIPVQPTLGSDIGTISREDTKHLLIPRADNLGLKCFDQLSSRSLVPPLLPTIKAADPTSRTSARKHRKSPQVPKPQVHTGTPDARAAVLKGALGLGRLRRLQRRTKFAATSHDLWADSTALTTFRPTDYQPSQLPSIELPHAGISYNPDPHAHQELLTSLEEQEQVKERAAAKTERKLARLVPTNPATPAELYREMSAGLFDDKATSKTPESRADDDKDDDESEEAETRSGLRSGANATHRSLTRKKRNPKARLNEKRSTQCSREKRDRKCQRIIADQLKQLPKIRKSIAREEKALALATEERRAKLREHEATGQKRLGPQRFEKGEPVFQLPEQLCGSLRLLKPEGSLLSDRFERLKRRNIIEPRNFKRQPHRTYALKKFTRK